VSDEHLKCLGPYLKVSAVHENVLHKDHVEWYLDVCIFFNALDLGFNLFLRFGLLLSFLYLLFLLEVPLLSLEIQEKVSLFDVYIKLMKFEQFFIFFFDFEVFFNVFNVRV
jgi:hypothetical protein